MAPFEKKHGSYEPPVSLFCGLHSGLSALRMGNFKQAEAHFLRGAMSPSNEGKGAFLSAAGAAAYNEGRLDDAASHFRLAYQCDSLKPSPMLLNNLAGIAIEQQKYDEAFQWGQLALSAYDRMTTQQQRSLDDGNFLEISNTNIFIAALRIGDPKKPISIFPKAIFLKMRACPRSPSFSC